MQMIECIRLESFCASVIIIDNACQRKVCNLTTLDIDNALCMTVNTFAQ